MYVYPIASSSSGNCTIFEVDDNFIIIDCGTTLKEIKTCIKDLSKVKAVFITHEHTDHISGIPALAKKISAPFYINEACVKKKPDAFAECKTIEPLVAGTKIILPFMEILPFTTKHDSAYSVGFILTKPGFVNKFGFVTDTGFITPMMLSYLKECDTIFLEADYDEAMLEANEEYSEYLKERIASNFGHLSNKQAIDFLGKVDQSFLKMVIFGHLSKRTNSPDLLKSQVKAVFPDLVFDIAPLTEKVSFEWRTK